MNAERRPGRDGAHDGGQHVNAKVAADFGVAEQLRRRRDGAYRAAPMEPGDRRDPLTDLPALTFTRLGLLAAAAHLHQAGLWSDVVAGVFRDAERTAR